MSCFKFHQNRPINDEFDFFDGGGGGGPGGGGGGTYAIVNSTYRRQKKVLVCSIRAYWRAILETYWRTMIINTRALNGLKPEKL